MNIVIVGGGTAGWLVSLYLAAQRPQHSYTTIDSTSIGPIGVGEAATGKFNQMLNECGISDWEFMLATDALPKHSLRFVNWAKTPGKFDSPLEYSASHLDPLDTRLFFQILNQQPIEHASTSGWYSLNDRTSYKLVNGQLQNTYKHGLQFDATKTANFLKSHAIKRGVRHVQEHITEVNVGPNGITSLQTETGNVINADLYIDCSGLSRLLISKLGAKLNSASDYIHVNSAMLFRLENDTRPKRTVGVSIARDHGWNFEISTRNRIGSGYVYDRHQVDRKILLSELSKNYQQPVTEIRTIQWDPGSLEQVWIGNCIAMGLSASFFEPLQTGAIHDTIAQIKYFVETSLLDTVEQTLDTVVVKSYNRLCSRLFNDYLDFLCVSYRGGRDDTEFWRRVTNEKLLTQRSQHIVDVARSRLTRELDFDKFLGYGSQGLHNYTLAGLGLFSAGTIESVFRANCIDINKLKEQQQEHNIKMHDEINQCLTSTQLNSILSNESLTLRA
jgi:tryptophan halogenase